MYASPQLLTVHHEEMLRAAAARRLVSQAKAAPAASPPRQVGSRVEPRGRRFGRLASQG
ncbi:MAG: hypothetical protein JO046_22880 [Solirubrobacterales bacterium]|nr:hypothetical protein [Solirubrobacterales bacterium]